MWFVYPGLFYKVLSMPKHSYTFNYLAGPIYITMKKEVHNAAGRLLEMLYAQDLDQAGLEALTLEHKHDAIALLIKEGLAFEDEVFLQTEERYSYYSLTEEGEKQFEAGGLKPVQKKSVIAYVVLFAAIAVVVVVILFLILLRTGHK